MKDVSVAQKLYEKYVMLCANDNRLTVTIARRPKIALDGTVGMIPDVIVGYQHPDGGFTPLASLLTKAEIDQMDPDFEAGGKLAVAFRKERKEDQRQRPEEFGESGQNPAFADAAITAMRLDG